MLRFILVSKKAKKVLKKFFFLNKLLSSKKSENSIVWEKFESLLVCYNFLHCATPFYCFLFSLMSLLIVYTGHLTPYIVHCTPYIVHCTGTLSTRSTRRTSARSSERTRDTWRTSKETNQLIILAVCQNKEIVIHYGVYIHEE